VFVVHVGTLFESAPNLGTLDSRGDEIDVRLYFLRDVVLVTGCIHMACTTVLVLMVFCAQKSLGFLGGCIEC